MRYFPTLILFVGLLVVSSSCEQGMSTRDLTSGARYILEHPDFKFRGAYVAGFPVWTDKSNPIAGRTEALELLLQTAVQTASRYVGELPATDTWNIVLLRSREEMKKLTNRSLLRYTMPEDNIMLVVEGDYTEALLRQAVFQMAATKVWGPSKSLMLYEGGAYFAGNYCGGLDYPFETLGAVYYDAQVLIPLRDLVENYDLVAGQNPVVAPTMAAGIFQWLYDNFNQTKIKYLWQQGFGRFEGIYGLTLGEFVYEFSGWLDNLSYDESFDYQGIIDNGCFPLQ